MANYTAIPKSDVQERLREMAEDIVAQVAELGDPANMEQLLGGLVSELFLTVAKDRQQKERRQRQAEGIAAAKARGVQFGPSRKPLPDSFDRYYEAWRNGEITLTEAAEGCGMVRASFRRAADRREESVRQERLTERAG